MVPQEALVAFVPFKELIEEEGDHKVRFLKKEFVNSFYLVDFRRRPCTEISLSQYKDRVVQFVHRIMGSLSTGIKLQDLDRGILEDLFWGPWTWGYKVNAFYEDLEVMVSSVFEEEFPRQSLDQ